MDISWDEIEERNTKERISRPEDDIDFKVTVIVMIVYPVVVIIRHV